MSERSEFERDPDKPEQRRLPGWQLADSRVGDIRVAFSLLTFLFGEAKESKSPDKAKQKLAQKAARVKTSERSKKVTRHQGEKQAHAKEIVMGRE